MKVLLATDGSTASLEAEWLLARIPFPEPLDLVLAHVMLVPSLAHLRHEFPAAVNEMLDQYQQRAKALLADEAKRFEGINGTVETDLRSGHAADELIELASERRSELIVIGARGLTPSQRLLVGSVSMSVARHAPCSVLVTRPAPEAHSSQRPLRMLVCHDGSESARQAIQTLSRFHWGEQVEITVLSVVLGDIYSEMMAYEKPSDVRQAERRQAQNALDWAVSQLQTTGAQVHSTLAEADSVADEIIARAEEGGADLIVMGHRGLNRIERFFLGSVSENVLRYAPCSVWIVREQAQD
jgi:nucleotide-binding universal stress UspA family protein